MRTPRLGIIGTGMISGEFAAAATTENAFDIAAVMSRDEARAASFAAGAALGSVAHATTVGDLASLDLDAVYIASPNSLHCDHTLAAIAAGLNVIVEKPAFWNPIQWQQVHTAAREAGVLVFEAARHIYEPGFDAVRNWAANHKITGASLNFHQYSSRWDAVLAGDEPNIFSLKHGGGALMDIGIYAVYSAVAWFGEPKAVIYRPQLAPTGVDAAGVLLLDYRGFTAELSFSKNQASALPSEIRAGRDRLVLNAVQGIDWAKSADGRATYRAEKSDRPLRELMRYEATAFAALIAAQREGGLSAAQREHYDYVTALSAGVNQVCTQARYSAGIRFEGEAA